MRRILVVTLHRESLDRIQHAAGPQYAVIVGDPIKPLAGQVEHHQPDLVFTDLALLGDSNGASPTGQVLNQIHHRAPGMEIVVMAESDQIRQAVGAVRAGAANYMIHPVAADALSWVIESAQERRLQSSELNYLRDQVLIGEPEAVARSANPTMADIVRKLRSVAPTRTTVLLTGETGTGKGVMAKLVHGWSHRSGSQFVAVHCGAITETLLESELFGHERGAFTGAVKRKLGKFEISRGGTLFLDEIGTMSPTAQIKLLQVLQDGTFSRVGGEDMLTTDARVIAATNTDLKALTDAGDFRKDLYYRLNVFPLELPALRHRLEDIAGLADMFLARLDSEMHKGIRQVHPDVLHAFSQYPWPGNIREMENLIERAYILETSQTLTPESFPAAIFKSADARPAIVPVAAHLPLAVARQEAVDTFERQYLKQLLARHHGRINQSAQEAGLSTRQLHKLMSKYGIQKEQFKLSPTASPPPTEPEPSLRVPRKPEPTDRHI